MRKHKGAARTRKVQQENSLGPNTLHFFSCTESARFSRLTDAVTGRVLDQADNPNLEIVQGDSPGISVNIKSIGSPVTEADSPWQQVGSDDFAIFACAKSKFVGAESYDGGCINFYFGNPLYGQLRVQPYLAGWIVDATGSGSGTRYNQIATPVDYDLLRRVEGQTYIVGAVKRGRYIEHWVDGELKGMNDVELILDSIAIEPDADNKAQLQLVYDTWYANSSAVNNGMSVGHGAYNLVVSTQIVDHPHLPISGYPNHDPADGRREIAGSWVSDAGNGYTGGVANLAQDYYGLLVQKFPDGAPADIGESMLYHKEQWTAGRKLVWSPWK